MATVFRRVANSSIRLSASAVLRVAALCLSLATLVILEAASVAHSLVASAVGAHIRWSISISDTLRSCDISMHGQYDGHSAFSRVGTCASTLWTHLAWLGEVASIGGAAVLPLGSPDPDRACASLNTWAIASLILGLCGSMLDALNTSVMSESPEWDNSLQSSCP
jgi:hypothetical protein